MTGYVISLLLCSFRRQLMNEVIGRTDCHIKVTIAFFSTTAVAVSCLLANSFEPNDYEVSSDGRGDEMMEIVRNEQPTMCSEVVSEETNLESDPNAPGPSSGTRSQKPKVKQT